MTQNFTHNFEWLKHYLRDKQALLRLSDLLPNQFDKYFLMPWIHGIIDNFPFNDYPEDFTAIDNLNHRHQIEKDFGIFLNKNVDHKYRPITLKELSEKFQVAYSVDTRHLIKSTPGITTLLQSTVATLQQLIIILTNNTELFFFIHDNHRFKFAIDNWKFEEENVISDVSDYIQFQKDTSWDSVSYLFPADREWCICTLEDYEHLILCCNDLTYKKIKGISGFETFAVDYGYKLLTT